MKDEEKRTELQKFLRRSKTLHLSTTYIALKETGIFEAWVSARDEIRTLRKELWEERKQQ